MLLMIKKRKIENGKLLALLEQATLNSNKKKYYKTLVQNNTRVVLHLQIQLKKIVDSIDPPITQEELEKFVLQGEGNIGPIGGDNDEISNRNKVLENARNPHKLMGVDITEARALYNRTACNTISDLCVMMEEYRSQGKGDRFRSILQSALITETKAKEVIANLEAITEYESRLHYEYADITKIESNPQHQQGILKGPKGIVSKDTAQLAIVDIESLNQAYTYLPFWDTNLSDNSDEGKYLQSNLAFSKQDMENFARITKCTSIRELIMYYRNNRRNFSDILFTNEECNELNSKGVTTDKILSISKLIIFLSAQCQRFSPQIFQFLEKERRIGKIDLRELKTMSKDALTAVFAVVFYLKHPVTRLDLTNVRIEVSNNENKDTDQKKVKNKDSSKDDKKEIGRDIGGLINILLSRKNEEMHEIQVSRCEIRVSFSNILKNIEMNPTVVTLNISGCNINFTTFIKLPILFNENSSLAILDASNNMIGDAGISELLKELCNRNTLRYLNISNNICLDKVIPALKEFIVKSKGLEVLEFEDNIFSETVADELQESILSAAKSNPSSNIKILKLGTFKEGVTPIGDIFKIPLSELRHLVLCKLTKTSGLGVADEIQSSNVPDNSALLLVHNLKSSMKQKPIQSPSLVVYNELKLLEKSDLVYLQKLYSSTIHEYESSKTLVIPNKINYLWKGYISNQTNHLIEKEVLKANLLARYLLAYCMTNFEEGYHLEILFLIQHMVLPSDPFFTDGFRFIHKVLKVASRTTIQEFINVSGDLNQRTYPDGPIVPELSCYHLAYFSKDKTLLRFLISDKVNTQLKDQFDNSIIHYASVFNDIETINFLLTGSDVVTYPEDLNQLGMQALHCAVIGDSLECFELLLSYKTRSALYKARILSKIEDGSTCLHLAVKYCSRAVFFHIVQILGADLEAQDKEKKTALMRAVEFNNSEFVEELLKRNAKVTITDIKEENVLFYAVRNANVYLFNKLSKLYSVDEIIAMKNNNDETLIYVAATSRCKTLITQFYNLGMSVNQPNKQNITALDLMYKSPDMMRLYNDLAAHQSEHTLEDLESTPISTFR